MGVIETKAFKSGNSVAVRLPAELGVAAGANLLIERVGTEVRIIVRDEEAERLARFKQMLKELEAIGPVPGVEDGRRDDADERVEFPERPGL